MTVVPTLSAGFKELAESYVAQGHAWSDIWQAMVHGTNHVSEKIADDEAKTDLQPDPNASLAPVAGTVVSLEGNAGSGSTQSDPGV